MITPIFKAKTVKGKLVHFEPETYKLWLQTFRDGTIVEHTVRRATKIRSLPENRYYWGVALKYIAGFTGYSVEEVHENMKRMFLQDHAVEHGMHHIKSTTDLITIEFEEYLEKIRRWALEFLQLYIPLPNEVEV